ncbi:hypothetical protein [Burkholderia cepacia]|uniref:hypothetical protein n=1 Tax=Burkholderia cepacia TaxID=292 RepID=UPI00158AAEAF|nr:hypothetical protein [Burkholderia cepacia]
MFEQLQEQITSDLSSALEGKQIRNYTKLVETQLDFWNESVFPQLELYLIPKYSFICKSLHKAGYLDIDERKLCDIVYRVNKKKRKHAPHETNQPVMTTPLAMKTREAPMVDKVVSAPVSTHPIQKKVAVAPARSGGVVLPEPATDEIDWSVELERLTNEYNTDFKKDISSKDVQILKFFDDYRKANLLYSFGGGDLLKIVDHFDRYNLDIVKTMDMLTYKFNAKNIPFWLD